MADFATVTDVENGWRPLSHGERSDVQMLITVASNWINERVTLPADSAEAKYVVVQVIRAALRQARYANLSTFSKTVGNVSESGTIANPSDGSVSLQFTRFHKELLGIADVSQQPHYQFGEGDYVDRAW